ncbi:unnamed protein product, partial [Schistosoma turkestanicum]
DLEDQYLLRLTSKAREKLFTTINTISEYFVTKCSNSSNSKNEKNNQHIINSDETYLCQLGDIMFDCVQYDCLRRLRYYWLPRWLLHWERIIRDCQFLPNNLGGSSLFYIPSRCSSLLKDDVDDDDQTQHNNHRESKSFSVGIQRTKSLTTSDIVDEQQAGDRDVADHDDADEVQYEETDELFDNINNDQSIVDRQSSSTQTTRKPSSTLSNDEKTWNKEIYDLAIKTALSKTGLIQCNHNNELLRSMPRKRLKSYVPSRLNSSNHKTTTMMTQLSSKMSTNDDIIQLLLFNKHSNQQSIKNKSLFKKFNLSSTIPYDLNNIIGLKNCPGSKWRNLKIQNSTTLSNITMKTIKNHHSLENQKSSIVIDSFMSTLGINNNDNSNNNIFSSNLKQHDIKVKSSQHKLINTGKLELLEKAEESLTTTKYQKDQNYSTEQILKNKCLSAIHADAASGGPFQSYLE